MKSNAVHLHHVRHPLLPSQCDRVGVPWPGNKSRSPKINRGPDIAWGFNAHICCTLKRILYATSEYLVAPQLGSLSYTLLRNFCRKVGGGVCLILQIRINSKFIFIFINSIICNGDDTGLS